MTDVAEPLNVCLNYILNRIKKIINIISIPTTTTKTEQDPSL